MLGDSLSAGYGIDVNKGWVALLQQRVNKKKITVTNASTTGDTTQNGLDKLPAFLAKYHPSITIIQLGGNDGLRGLSLEKMAENLTAMIKMSNTQHSKVLIIGVPMFPNYGAEFIQHFEQVFVDVGKTQHVPVVNNILEKVADKPLLMQLDKIHPKAQGQKQMLENVWPKLAPLI